MEQLNDTLEINNATIEEWTHRRTKKDGLKVNFTVSAMLPRELADKLKCAAIYELDTGQITLLHKIKDTELIFPVPGVEGASASFFPDVLYCFKAKRDQDQFTVEFAAHVTIRADELHEILKGSAELIDIEIRPRQGQLFEGGTRVEVDDKDRIISKEQAADTSAATDEPGAPLAPAAVMGGTHQRKAGRTDKGTVN